MMSSCSIGPSQKSVYNPVSKPTSEFQEELKYVREWNEMLYHHIKHQVVGPPIAARMYGYLGLTFYESVVGGMPDHYSLSGQLNDFSALPTTDPSLEYDWPSVMIEALYYVCDELLSRFLSGSDKTLSGLHQAQKADRSGKIAPEVFDRSLVFGKLLSEEILKWAATDNYDDTRFKFYKTPPRIDHPEYWEPTDFNMKALEPFWPTLRPFVLDNANVCPMDLPHPYSEEEGSGFYLQAKAVLDADQNLTEQQREDALYWADCPGETATPPGHWSFILGYVSEEQSLNLAEAAEMYALAGIGIADAFIQCWYTKYDINLVRPKTYIREVFGLEEWEPFVITPPFPEFTSGHSTVSGCVAELLTMHMGDDITFTDSTHVRIGLPPRSFRSFREAAQQAADSRLYGGMHYPMANEAGVEQGRCIAKQIYANIKLKEEQ